MKDNEDVQSDMDLDLLAESESDSETENEGNEVRGSASNGNGNDADNRVSDANAGKTDEQDGDELTFEGGLSGG